MNLGKYLDLPTAATAAERLETELAALKAKNEELEKQVAEAKKTPTVETKTEELVADPAPTVEQITASVIAALKAEEEAKKADTEDEDPDDKDDDVSAETETLKTQIAELENRLKSVVEGNSGQPNVTTGVTDPGASDEELSSLIEQAKKIEDPRAKSEFWMKYITPKREASTGFKFTPELRFSDMGRGMRHA